MYLSLLLVDVGENPDRPRPGRSWLRNRYRVHQRLCMAFPFPETVRKDPKFLEPFDPAGFRHVHGPRTVDEAFLFRVDPLLGGRVAIQVQSSIRPDWNYAFQNATFLLAAPPQVQPFDPVFTAGESLRFRLLANPTRRLSRGSAGPDGKPVDPKWIGKRVPVPFDQLQDWLNRQAEKSGFRIRELSSLHSGYLFISQGPGTYGADLFSVQYDGILEVEDPVRFQDAVVHGLGPAKGFGFGLLSVTPP